MRATRLSWKIMLDQPRKIRFSKGAIYKLQSLPDGFDMADINNDRKQIATITQLVWAMLCEGDEVDTPVAVAEMLPLGEPARMEEIVRTVNEAIDEVTKEREEKNGQPGNSPTPGSSCG
jgi:hypothetical protein